MIIPKQWIKLSEIHQRLSRYVLENDKDGGGASDLEALANELCWKFCQNSKKVFLHEAGDKAIEYPKTYVEPPEAGVHFRANELVDLSVGVPGSGTTKFIAIGKGEKIFHVAGPYVGSPILFHRKEFEKFFKSLNGDITGSADHSESSIKKTLLEKHNAGTYKSKEVEWENYNGLVPRRRFNAAFKAAKQEDASFGKVGKPPAKTKQTQNPNN